jgi:sugar phosphate isomerase/epimerase
VACAGVAAASLHPNADAEAKSKETRSGGKKQSFEIGLASYTFRKFKIEDCMAMTRRLGLKKIALKDMHMPLTSTDEEIKILSQKMRDAGLELYGCGVVYMQNEDEVKRAFDYAMTAGMKTIIGVPDHALLPLVNDKVKEYDITVSIHNHGPTDQRYPTPQSAYEKIRDLDSRIGLCIDVGHTQRSGIDPSDAVRQYADRLKDVHIKDVNAASKEGTTVEMGRGVIDIPSLFKTLVHVGFLGVAALEHEKDPDDPLPGAAESIGYTHGVLATL